MQIDSYVQALRDDLASIAALGDENTARAAQLLAVALESAFGRRLLDALNEASLEIGSQIPSARVEIRLAGADVELVLVDEEPEGSTGGDEELSARITLRLPESLKSKIEQAAGRDGLSVNTWIVQSLLRANTTSARPSVGRRLTGFGQS